MNISRGFDLITLSFLLDAPATSIDVERSFSLLGKLLNKDRPFDMDNVKDYLGCFYNK